MKNKELMKEVMMMGTPAFLTKATYLEQLGTCEELPDDGEKWNLIAVVERTGMFVVQDLEHGTLELAGWTPVAALLGVDRANYLLDSLPRVFTT